MPKASPSTPARSPPINGSPVRGLRLGAHESIAGGLFNALERGAEHGAEAVQIFTKSARGWAAKPLSAEDKRAYHDAAAKTALPSAAHASYLINLAADPETAADHRGKSIAALADDWNRAAALGLVGLIVHPGSHPDPARGTALVAEALNEVQRRVPRTDTLLLLENTAGQGSSLGWRLEGLAALLDATDAQGAWAGARVGVCIDTCHLFAAGYDLTSAKAYAVAMAEISDRIGLERVKAFHLNDSKGPCGNRLDRHENIGEGHLGTKGFEALVNDQRFAGLPGFLETEEGEQKKNLKTLKELRG